MINVSVYFNNFNLASLPGIRIVNYNISDLPSRNLQTMKLARANRSMLTSAEYTTKNVTVTGFMGGDTHLIQQDNFDRLKAYLQEVEGTIRVQQGSKFVEYAGTLNSISKEWNGPSLGFTLTFECSNPIGRDATTMNLFPPVTITTASAPLSLVVEGSFEAEPRFSIMVNSIVGGGTVLAPKTVSILNAATGKGIRITRVWAQNDIVSIASDVMEVTANAQTIDFQGQFPKFLPGARTIQYIDNFDSRNVTLSATYNRKYS